MYNISYFSTTATNPRQLAMSTDLYLSNLVVLSQGENHLLLPQPVPLLLAGWLPVVL